MAIGDISLTASARANLLSLQGTASFLAKTQNNLATGKKVNSALDNATSYFQSQGFLNSASDLSSLKDGLATALQTIKAANDAITSLTSVVTQLQGVINSALQTTDATTRSSLAAQYNGILSQLDSLADDSTFNGTNLVNSITSSLKVVFNASNTTSLTIQGQNLSSTGLGVGTAVGAFAVGQLATQTTYSLTVQNAAATITTATYTGTIDGLSVTGAAATTVPSATITSTSGDYTNGARVISTAATASGLNSAVTGSTLDPGTSANSGAGTTTASTVIRGQFTVGTGTGASTLSSGVFTIVGSTATVSVAAGDSIQVVYDSGTSSASITTTVYTNTGSSAVSFTLAATNTVNATSSLNNSFSYKLTGGTVAKTGITLENTGTLGGYDLVDSQNAVAAQSLTSYGTVAAATGATAGTTTSTGQTVYDISGATVTTLAATDVTATVTNYGTSSTASYSATNATLSLTGVTTLTGSKTQTTADAITTAQNQLNTAKATLRSAASGFGNNNTLVQTRSDFTTNLINTLQTASDNLVLADTNEEGANLQALQARNQLGIVSLGISGDLAQSILRLF